MKRFLVVVVVLALGAAFAGQEIPEQTPQWLRHIDEVLFFLGDLVVDAGLGILGIVIALYEATPPHVLFLLGALGIYAAFRFGIWIYQQNEKAKAAASDAAWNRIAAAMGDNSDPYLSGGALKDFTETEAHGSSGYAVASDLHSSLNNAARHGPAPKFED